MRNWLKHIRRPAQGRAGTANTEEQPEIARLKAALQLYELGWPPGHFYSPIPSLEQVREQEERIWGDVPRRLPGIELNEEKQLNLLAELEAYYPAQPWNDQQQEHLRFYFDNPNFSYGESVMLYCLLRHLKPRRVIEVGSGYSSCALLDTNEFFFENALNCTFIEPYPELLYTLLKPADVQRITILPDTLQQAGKAVFQDLSAGDIVFIDSTHVSKIDSDVNHLLFSILPELPGGVYIHVHDIYYPFEYPKEWIYQGRAWNEAYVLRAFLQYNTAFEIVLFNSFLGQFHNAFLLQQFPLMAKNPGSSLWLRKK